jgi:hypothetical protein
VRLADRAIGSGPVGRGIVQVVGPVVRDSGADALARGRIDQHAEKARAHVCTRHVLAAEQPGLADEARAESQAGLDHRVVVGPVGHQQHGIAGTAGNEILDVFGPPD